MHATVFDGYPLTYTATSGTVTSAGDNVTSAGQLAGPGDLTSTDPKLGVLTYNGGPVPTVNTKPGSPAIGHVGSPTVRADQRRIPRPTAGADSGAVQRIVGGDVNDDGTVNVADVFSLINFLFAGGPVPLGEADANGDGKVDVVDVFYLINAIFAGGPAPV